MRFICVAAVACALFAGIGGTHAQTSPGLSYGQIPTAGQWNSYFAMKQDFLNFTPLNVAGGTMQGEIRTAPATGSNASLNIALGVMPISPVNGDMWMTSEGLFARVNGVTQQVASAALNWVGPWQNATNYSVGAIVSHNGASWIAIAANTNSEPRNSNPQWNVFSPPANIQDAVTPTTDFSANQFIYSNGSVTKPGSFGSTMAFSSSTLSVNPNLSITSLATSGAAGVGGTLGVTGNSTFTGADTHNNTILFGGSGVGRLNDVTSIAGNAATFYYPTYVPAGGSTTFPATGVVHRLNRIYVGEAVLNDSATPAVVSDWANNYIPNTNIVTGSQFASVSTNGGLAITGVARTSDFAAWAAPGQTSGGTQGVTGFGLVDSDGAIACGVCGIAWQDATHAGVAVASQLDTTNLGTYVQDSPHGRGITTGLTYDLILTTGAYVTGNNITAFEVWGKGVTALAGAGRIIRENSLDTSIGQSGGGMADEFPLKTEISWWGSDNNVYAQLWGDSDGLHAPQNLAAVSLQTTSTTVAGLGTCTSANKNQRWAVTDAVSPTYLASLTGGGSTYSPALCNGAAWVSGG